MEPCRCSKQTRETPNASHRTAPPTRAPLASRSLAQQDLGVAFRSKQSINPIERGHIAYRTDNIEAFKAHLDKCGVPYADYGTTFAKEWYQIFCLDPEGTVVEVHAVVG